MKFGKLHIVNMLPNRKVFATCECGNSKEFWITNILAGQSKSCGCLISESLKERNKTHGKSRTPTYQCWINMRSRCKFKSVTSFKDYGGRGIKVCDRWINSFENFLADMGDKPDGMEIDRKDTNGNYTPENCQWSTPLDQSNNRRNNVIVTYAGERLTMSQLARNIGMDYLKLYKRIVLRGWEVNRAVETP